MSTATARPELIKLECPNCGRPVQQFDPGAQTIVCDACGSYIEVGSGEPQAIGRGSRLQKLNVPLKVGDHATIDGTDYFVLGRVDYLGWSQNDRSETWRWTEWLLGEKKGRLLWLSYDEKGFTLYQKVRNTPRFDAQRARRIPVGNGREISVHERYPARITAAQGELTWRPKIDSELLMIDAAGFGKRYSVQQTGQEVEVYEGDPVDELALAKQFNDAQWVKRVNRRKENARLWMEIGVLCVLFAFIGLVGAFIAGNMGDTVQRETVRLSPSNPTTTVPVALTSAGRPAAISTSLNGALPRNTSFDVDVNVIAPNETRTFLFSQFFWHETGRDSDGAWTDTQYRTTSQFVPMEEGQHVLELTMTDPVSVDSVTLDVTVQRNRFVVGWLIAYTVLTAIASVIAFVMAAGVKEVTSTLAQLAED
jgi:ribosomal protein S27E